MLVFLYIGVFFAVIGAWFAILFTGRYPRGILDFVEGVFRWYNRVVAYAYILITDAYPPFSLKPLPGDEAPPAPPAPPSPPASSPGAVPGQARMSTPPSASERSRLRENWQDEIDIAALYRALADAEDSPQLAEVYRRPASAEERHASFWAERLRAAGSPPPEPRVGWRTRVLIALARRLGVQLVLPTLNDLERADSRSYESQPESSGTELPEEERSHEGVLPRYSGARTR